MTSRLPLHGDTVAPAAFRRMIPGTDTVHPSVLPLADDATRGAVILAAGTPADVGAAGSVGTATDAAREDHVHAHGAQSSPTHHAVATPNAAGFASADDKNKLDRVHEPPRFKLRRRVIRPFCAQSTKWVAGAAASAPTGHPAHLFPFMVPTQINYEGHPHYDWRRLESNLSDGNTPSYDVNGYESGRFVAAGSFIRGRGVDFDMACRLTNELAKDAFFEFVLEPNPLGDTYDGPYRMRMLSDELGRLTVGDELLIAHIELRNEGRKAYSWAADYRLFAASGACVWRKEVGGFEEDGFDWLGLDALLQLRFRVDRIANLDVYDATYQGDPDLRLAVRSIRGRNVGCER